MFNCPLCNSFTTLSLLKIGAIIGWVLIGAIFLLKGNRAAINASSTDNTQTLNTRAIERRVHEKINRERTGRGLDPLSYDTEIAAIARNHSRDMAKRNYFAHESPNGDAVEDRYENAGYECMVETGDGHYATGGENLAQTWWQRPLKNGTYKSPEGLAAGLVDQWMHSKSHRENLLKPYWKSGGIGIVVTSDGKVYATQNFC